MTLRVARRRWLSPERALKEELLVDDKSLPVASAFFGSLETVW